MREDMAKVLVERPRKGAGWDRKGRKPRLLSEAPLLEGERYRSRTKNLNENLGPLKRYLRRQVNRPWSKVHSEMRQRIKPGNTVQEHILLHVDQFLHIEVTHVAPDARHPCGLAHAPHLSRYWPLRPGDLYVDPRDGIIKVARRKVSAR